MRAYSEAVLAHFRKAARAGRLAVEEVDVGSGEAAAEAGPERIHIQVRIAGDEIVDAVFRAFGCPVAIACGSYAAERAACGSLAEAAALGADELVRDLELSPESRAIAILSLRALREAVADAERKRAR